MSSPFSVVVYNPSIGGEVPAFPPMLLTEAAEVARWLESEGRVARVVDLGTGETVTPANLDLLHRAECDQRYGDDVAAAEQAAIARGVEI